MSKTLLHWLKRKKKSKIICKTSQHLFLYIFLGYKLNVACAVDVI